MRGWHSNPNTATQSGDSGMTKRFQKLRNNWANRQQGGIGYVFLWLLGVPIPVLILISLLRGCS
jgi:hypothetical protein